MSESKKLFFSQLLYTLRQLKNFGFIDKYHFWFFSTLPTVQRRDDHNVVDHHVEMIIMLSQLNSLYSGESGQVSVNAMNAPNNSTLQVQNTSLLSGCWHIDENWVPQQLHPSFRFSFSASVTLIQNFYCQNHFPRLTPQLHPSGFPCLHLHYRFCNFFQFSIFLSPICRIEGVAFPLWKVQQWITFTQ